VKASELSEIITHLAFYAGWANAISAVAVAKDIFHQRGIGIDQLPPAKDKLLPLNEETETQRATQVNNNFGHVSPASYRTPRTCYSVNCGCGQRWHLVIAALQRLAP